MVTRLEPRMVIVGAVVSGSGAPETVTLTILQLLPVSNTLVPEAVTLTRCRTLSVGMLLKASVLDPGTITNWSESPPVPII